MEQTVTWQSPSNIALVKYWGKTGNQFPTNPSISITLTHALTQTTVKYRPHSQPSGVSIDFTLEGQANEKFAARVIQYLNKIAPIVPTIKGLHLSIDTKNTFPHSSGIASSASAMSALALCLMSIESQLTGTQPHTHDFFQKASELARIGSGSAARSVYGGYVVWGALPQYPEYSNHHATPINHLVNRVFMAYADAILLVTNHEKKVSSSVGHGLMQGHPFAKTKFEVSHQNTQRLLEVLQQGDAMEFCRIVESEALYLHAMMMTSNPDYLLMEPGTVAIIHKIRQFRHDTGIACCFTLDAGANVHFLYPTSHRAMVIDFITQALLPHCANQQFIDDVIGKGPHQL